MKKDIEYKLLGKNNLPVTFEDFKNINESVKAVFNETDTTHLKDGLRTTFGVNDEQFHLIYGYMGPSLIIPNTNYGEKIKKTIKNLDNNLRFRKIQCQ
jgi:hypothetical protein